MKIEKELIVNKKKNGELRFSFKGFDEWEDFVKIAKIIKVIIKPEDIHYSGLTDIAGYFIKDELKVEMVCFMLGNYWSYKGEMSEEKMAKVRHWANMVFEVLMQEERGK
jgi:hypothetical protein